MREIHGNVAKAQTRDKEKHVGCNKRLLTMKGKYLTADQIQRIEKLLQDAELSLQAIAERMNLSHRVICTIHKRIKAKSGAKNTSQVAD